MKLSDVNVTFVTNKLRKNFEFYYNATDGVDEELQIDIIHKYIENDYNRGVYTKTEYFEARAMLCDIALNYFK